MQRPAKQLRLERPDWIKKKIIINADFNFTKNILKDYNVNTVCKSARCPNIFDCYSKRTVSFLILGDTCTRRCRFCSVKNGEAQDPDGSEPARIAEIIVKLKLRHVVITSVTRDDLDDEGSGHFLRVIRETRNICGKDISIEALVPDFSGNRSHIEKVATSDLNIFGHNVETVPRLYKKMRPSAVYERSINVLRLAKSINPSVSTKSAIMLGLGEKMDEVISVMKDLRAAKCDIIAIGQYLRPSLGQAEVKKFIRPDEFLKLKEIGYSLGFSFVNSGSFVRSSYMGGDNG